VTEEFAPWSDQTVRDAASRIVAAGNATVIYERLRGHPFMGCDCCTVSLTDGLDCEDDALYDQVSSLDRVWIIALDLAAAVLGIRRDGRDARE
jgi:hypothetical protein